MRNRSMAVVIRDDQVLMIQTLRRGKPVWELPGGGIEEKETPEEAALRELKEECGVDGTLLRPLNTMHDGDGSTEYAFLASIPEGQIPYIGFDPEPAARGEAQSIQNVAWKKLSELTERDRVFLWHAGLLSIGSFFKMVLGWSDDISYPEDTSL